LADLKLTPEQTTALQTAIGDTYADASALIQRIAGGYASIAGSSWSGSASNAAMNKQQEFQDIWRNLAQILSDLQSGVSGTTQMVGSQDDDYQNLINAVDGGGGGMNFGRL
jgi:WXG100 family type VII secretion target